MKIEAQQCHNINYLKNLGAHGALVRLALLQSEPRHIMLVLCPYRGIQKNKKLVANIGKDGTRVGTTKTL